ATGRTDVLPTSLHAQCPGVVAHGVIFNAILTNHFWRPAPGWLAPIVTVVMGFLAALIAGRIAPIIALPVTILLAGMYLLVNGLVLFDAHHMTAGLAGPLLATGLVWSGCTLTRIMIESAERSRITRRFQTYVDPTLVNYLIERPDEVRLEGERRE